MYHKLVLDNGLRVVIEEMRDVRSVSVGIWVKVGTRNEKPECNGLSHFIEHMLFKGTQSRGVAEIAQEMDSLGGQMGASTGREFTCYYARVLDEHLPQAMDILSDILYNSVFSQEEVEREKRVIMEEIKMYEDSPDELIHDLFAYNVWSNHPLGQSILGTREVIDSLSSQKVVEFWQNYYTAKEIVIAIAGNVKIEEAIQLVKRFFGKPDKTTQPRFDSGSPGITSGITVHTRELEQVHLCLGSLGLTATDEDRFALRLLSTIVGGGMSSRLFQEIREKRALSYDVHSYVTAYEYAGLFVVYVGTSAQHYQEVIKVILEEFGKLKVEKVDMDELRRAKDRMKGKLVLAMEDSAFRMSRLAEQELFFGRFFSLDEILESVEKVTQSDIQSLAQRIFLPDYLALNSLGPLTQKEAKGVILRC